MPHLLHIDSSPRGGRSHSRQLSQEFVEAWRQAHPNDVVSYRDVGRHPVPPIDESWIAAVYAPPEQRTAQHQAAIQLSDRLVAEFLAADVYVLGVPMYNFSIPSPLKAYIDQIVRPGLTFEPENAASPYKPLVLGKQMFILTARGSSGYGPGGRFEKMNHQDPYLSTIFGFIGITDITCVHVENDELGGTSLAQSIASAQSKIAQLVSSSIGVAP